MNEPKGVPLTVYLEGSDGNAAAILREVESLVRGLVESDEGGSIDLQGLPLAPEDRHRLEEELGVGEVRAEIDAMGITQVQETAVPGVWWVVHHNEAGELIGEFIEVGYCPEILITPAEDVKEGWDALRARLVEKEYSHNRRSGGNGSE